MNALRLPAIPKASFSLHNVLAAIPKYLVDKFLVLLSANNSPANEEIALGKLRVITGTKYRQFCRAKYGPNLLDLFADKYLSNPTTEGGRLAFVTGPTAVRVYRGLLGVGEIGDDDLSRYEEESEGVTTIPLPPIAPVLLAFLIWRAGKHGIKFFESWRDRQKTTGQRGEERRKEDAEPRQGLLDAMYERMMTFVDSEIEFASQEGTGSELSALELPFLVALPQDPTSSVQLNSLLSDQDSVPTLPPQPQRRSVVFALGLSSPDSVGLQRVLLGTHSPDMSPAAPPSPSLSTNDGQNETSNDDRHHAPRSLMQVLRDYDDDIGSTILARSHQDKRSELSNQANRGGHLTRHDADGSNHPEGITNGFDSADTPVEAMIIKTSADATNGRDGDVMILLFDGDEVMDECERHLLNFLDKEAEARPISKTRDSHQSGSSIKNAPQRSSAATDARFELPSSRSQTNTKTPRSKPYSSSRPKVPPVDNDSSAVRETSKSGRQIAHTRETAPIPNPSNSRLPPPVTPVTPFTSRNYSRTRDDLPTHSIKRPISAKACQTHGLIERTNAYDSSVFPTSSRRRFSIPPSSASELPTSPRRQQQRRYSTTEKQRDSRPAPTCRPIQSSVSQSSQDPRTIRSFLLQREESRSSDSHRRKSSVRAGPPLTPLVRARSHQPRGAEIRRPDSPHPQRPVSNHGKPAESHLRHPTTTHRHPPFIAKRSETTERNTCNTYNT